MACDDDGTEKNIKKTARQGEKGLFEATIEKILASMISKT